MDSVSKDQHLGLRCRAIDRLRRLRVWSQVYLLNKTSVLRAEVPCKWPIKTLVRVVSVRRLIMEQEDWSCNMKMDVFIKRVLLWNTLMIVFFRNGKCIILWKNILVVVTVSFWYIFDTTTLIKHIRKISNFILRSRNNSTFLHTFWNGK